MMAASVATNYVRNSGVLEARFETADRSEDGMLDLSEFDNLLAYREAAND